MRSGTLNVKSRKHGIKENIFQLSDANGFGFDVRLGNNMYIRLNTITNTFLLKHSSGRIKLHIKAYGLEFFLNVVRIILCIAFMVISFMELVRSFIVGVMREQLRMFMYSVSFSSSCKNNILPVVFFTSFHIISSLTRDIVRIYVTYFSANCSRLNFCGLSRISRSVSHLA